jgi:hypothetical protein
MPDYEVRYLRKNGSIADSRTVQCANDRDVKSLAAKKRLKGASQVEVWAGETLILTRAARKPGLLGLLFSH